MWYIYNVPLGTYYHWRKLDENAECGPLACARFRHLGDRDDLLRECRPSHLGDHELTLLDGLCFVADPFSDSLYCDSSMAADRPHELDISNAPTGDSRD